MFYKSAVQFYKRGPASRKETASLILIHLLSDNVTHGHGNHQVSRVTRAHITSRGGKHKTGTIEL